MKEELINNILLKMQGHLNRDQLYILEKVLLAVLFKIEVTQKETSLSTDMDDNEYMLKTIEFNMRKRELSEKTIAQYMRAARMFVDSVHKNLRNIAPMDIEYYLIKFSEGRKHKNQAQSVNNERQFLSAIFVWLRRCNFITKNPVENVLKKKRIKPPIDFLRGVEIEELRTACNLGSLKGKRERAILEFLLSTGVRVGEIPSIKITDVDIAKGEILIYGFKDREYRTVFLYDSAKVHLKKYLDARQDNNPYLFVSLKSPYQQIHECAIRDILNDIKNNANINRRIYPHLMRKTTASICRDRGVPLDDIAEILGHKDTQVTRTYYAASSITHLHNIHNNCMG